MSENDFFEDKHNCSIEGLQNDWEICDHCKWQDVVSEYEPPCCYCKHYELQAYIPEGFDYEQLKEKYKIK